MKKETLQALIVAGKLINKKIEYYENRLKENKELLEDSEDKNMKESIEYDNDIYSCLVGKYQKHLNTIKELINEINKN